jgi:hypothetical protein
MERMASAERSEQVLIPHGDTMSTVIGVGFMTFFGAIWWLMAAGYAEDARAAMLIVGAAVVTVLVWQIVRLRRSANSLNAHRPDHWEVRQRTFSWIGAAEGIAIAIGAIVCGTIGHPEWIPVWCMFVVGVHFLPLARLFDVPLYTITGVMLALGALLAAIVLAFAGLPEAAWFIIPGVLSAFVLWVTAAMLLRFGAVSD